MTNDIHFHGGFQPTIQLSRGAVRRATRRLERLIHADPSEPVRVAECIALGAWRRLTAGERRFSPQMWQLVEEVIGDPAGTELSPPAAEVWELTDEEAADLLERAMVLHINLAAGHFRYIDDRQNSHGLLISEGLLGMLEYGRRRFAGAPMLGFIDTVGR